MIDINMKKESSMRERRNLSGDRNQCPTCGKFFNSTAAFEKHRVGEVGGRRCRTTEEMLSIGMALNSTDWWVTALMTQEILEKKMDVVLE